MALKRIQIPGLTLFGLAFLIVAGCRTDSHKTKTGVDKEGFEVLADSILNLMTLEEKIGQLNLFTSDWAVTGPTLRTQYRDDIRAGKVGAIFNAHTADYNHALQKIAVEETRLGIPLLFGYDVVHGYKTIFPVPLGEAASWDLEAMEKSARISAVEAAAAGLSWTFAPMIDVARDPRWGRVVEGVGEDPYLGSLIARAKVSGFQGTDLSSPVTLLACAKHYAAYGAAQAGRDYHTVDISDRVLREVYLTPFKEAIDAGAATLMTAFNEVDGIPASGNKYLLTDILRNEWGFQGFVVTDYTSIQEMVKHGIVADDKEAGELALNAGVDMDMQSAIYYDYMATSLEEGKVSERQIDDAVRRILIAKYTLGLFEDPYKYGDTVKEKEVILSKEHLEYARDIARKSIVLLKNNSILPLKRDIGTIALIGPLADNITEINGSWRGAGNNEDCVSLLKGIEESISGRAAILHAKGCDFTGSDKSGFSEAVRIAKRSKIIIAAVGEPAGMSGEASSRSQINMPGVQLDLVKELVKTGKPVIVVLMNGRPLAIPWIDENTDAILETWFLGTQTGNAIADVLFGDYNPAGKLTISFPRNEGQIPIFYSMKNTGRPLSEEKWTSKYLDVPNSPLYPFGFGLSYTSFEYSDVEVSKSEFSPDEIIKASVQVTNTGPVSGEEVVQLYIRDLVGSVTRPVKELKGFEKIHLNPGESRTVEFSITSDLLRFLDKDMNFLAEPGDFDIYIATNSTAGTPVRITLLKS